MSLVYHHYYETCGKTNVQHSKTLFWMNEKGTEEGTFFLDSDFESKPSKLRYFKWPEIILKSD